MFTDRAKKFLTLQMITFIILVILISIFLFVMWSQNNTIHTLQSELDITKARLQSTEQDRDAMQEQLNARIAELGGTKDLIKALRTNINKHKSVNQLEEMVTKATGVVAQLQKLENTDKELLSKYSKVYFLNEHYIPKKLSLIPSKYNISGNGLKVKEEVNYFLMEMISEMEEDGLNPRIVSAYRSFEYQEALKKRYKNKYGAVADTFSADQGFSEHQLGTTVDFSNKSNGSDLEAFKLTEEYEWLVSNAHNYGFVLSYPDNNSYYQYEPWHWRFVGIALAQKLNEQGKHFYDLSQREINIHLIDIFDK